MDNTQSASGTEDQVTKGIESQTSRLPSVGFLALALGCMAVSAFFKSKDRNDVALFVGQWPAPLLVMGLYNKVVKQLGSDQTSRATAAAY